MRAITKIGAAAAAVGLAATMAACSSSGDTKPVGQFKTLTGNTTSVALDSGFVKALTSLKLTPSPFGTATVSKAGVASFPITGGNATIYKKGDVTPYVQGEIDHNGSGLNLTSASGTKVTIENFVIHPGNNSELTGDVLVNGKSFAKGADLFTLDGSTLKTPTISGGVATLTGTRVLVSKTAASALNTAFKTNAVKANLLVGIATIKATGK